MKKRGFETYQKRFRDFEILLKFSETHVFRDTIRHPYLVFLVSIKWEAALLVHNFVVGGAL